MSLKLVFAVAVFACLTTAPVAADPAVETGAVVVNLTGCQSDAGHVIVMLYRSEDGFAKSDAKAWRRQAVGIDKGAAVARFADVPYGTYAVSVYHDKNDNQKLDTNFLGIPREGVAASNNAKGHFGPPKFKDAQFPLQGRELQMTLQMVYL